MTFSAAVQSMYSVFDIVWLLNEHGPVGKSIMTGIGGVINIVGLEIRFA